MSATGPVLIFEASLYTVSFYRQIFINFFNATVLWIFAFGFSHNTLLRRAFHLPHSNIHFCPGWRQAARFCHQIHGRWKYNLFLNFYLNSLDIFATLISAIFIAESLHFVWHTFKENPVEDYNFYERIHLNCHQPNFSSSPAIPDNSASLPFDIEQLGNWTRNSTTRMESGQRLSAALAQLKDPKAHRRLNCGEAEPNTALLTAIIVFSTFILAFMLKKLRESFYLGKHVGFLINLI